MESTQPTTIRLDDFLAALYPDPQEKICFRGFQPRDVPLTPANTPMVFYATRDQVANDAQTQGLMKSVNIHRGIYFNVNAGGSNDLSITRYNAFFCECDDISIQEQHEKLDNAPLPPSVRIETRKSVHAYWLAEAGCSEETWRDIQMRLIRHFDADEKNKNPSRVLRVPFFAHLAPGPDGTLQRQRVQIVHFNPALRYTGEQMQAAFEPAEMWEQITPAQDVNRAMLAEVKKASGSGFETWDVLNAEAKLRIVALPSFKASKGWGHAKGVCHNGSGDTGLALNLNTGAYHCQKGCTTSTVLQALGLPEIPESRTKVDITGGAAMAASGTPNADPLAGVYDVAALSAAIDKLYEEGMLPGVGTGWAGFTELYTVKTGQLSIWTGMPAHGKSAVLDALMVNIALAENWHFLICSPENQPLERHCAVLMEIYTGKPFRKGMSTRMSPAELQKAKEWLAKHFTFICPDEASTTVDGILNIIAGVHTRRPVNAVVLDPWNELEHKRPAALSETEYISSSLSRIRRYGRNNKTHMFIVAHPTKIYKDKDGAYPVPTLYDINGSANWRNKADMGVVVWRDITLPGGPTDVHVQKVRFRECGQIGTAQLYFDVVSGRFSEDRGTFRMPRERAQAFIDESAARTEAEIRARQAVDAIDTAPVAKPKTVKVIEEPLEDDNPLADYFADEFTPPSDAAPVQYDVNNPPF